MIQKSFMLALLVLTLSPGTQAALAAETRPNILLIVIAQHPAHSHRRYGVLGLGYFR